MTARLLSQLPLPLPPAGVAEIVRLEYHLRPEPPDCAGLPARCHAALGDHLGAVQAELRSVSLR